MTEPESELVDDTYGKPVREEVNPEPDGPDIVNVEEAS